MRQVLFVSKTVGKLREDFDAAFQNAVQVGQEDAVVGDGDALVGGAFHAVADLPLVEHTAAAMDHQLDARQVIGELGAGADADVQGLARPGGQEPGDLDGADVVALAVVGILLF